MNNDYYNINSDWELIKSGFKELKSHLDEFLKVPHKKKSGVDIRQISKELERTNRCLRRNIIRKRKEYQSDYS